MAKTQIFKHHMREGTYEERPGVALNDEYHYDKRTITLAVNSGKNKETGRQEVKEVKNTAFYLTHTETGMLVTSSRTLKALKMLLQEPEFHQEDPSVEDLYTAYTRWFNRDWASIV